MVVRFTTTHAISAYYHKCSDFESRLGEMYSIQHYVIKFVSDLRFSLGTLVSYTSKSYRHDIAEILFKVALNTITLHCNSNPRISDMFLNTE